MILDIICCILYVFSGSTLGVFLQSPLNASWTLSNEHMGININNVQLPSGIYTDLRKGGVLPDEDVYYRFNDKDFRWVANENWNYSTIITEKISSEKSKNIFFLLQGIDTVSRVYFNDLKIGETSNMFHEYYFKINSSIYKNGKKNHIRIELLSPIKYAASEAKDFKKRFGYDVPPDCTPKEYGGECHANFIRKMQSSFGWDWGPAFPSMGIWKPISLLFPNSGIEFYELKYVKWTAKESLDGKTWNVDIEPLILSTQKSIKGQLKVEIPELRQKIVSNVNGTPTEYGELMELTQNLNMTLKSSEINIWWPNGYGNQKLYELEVWLLDVQNNVLGHKSLKVAFRTVELVQDPVHPKGLTFKFRINHVDIFAKGSNWIPSHALPELMDKNRTTDLLNSFKEANMNTLRVWGGGIYESDQLYETADELGILIWQDFMFACSMYPAETRFIKSVSREVDHQVRRLQHHASIGLWSANNENEAALSGNWYSSDEDIGKLRKDYSRLYIDTVQEIVNRVDPSRSILISSPSNGKGPSSLSNPKSSPYSSLFGDLHYYNYYSDSWNPSSYPSTRFASEYGFQSLSSLKVLKSVAIPKVDLSSLDSRFFSSREHHLNGLLQLKSQISMYLNLPKSLLGEDYVDYFIYLTQIYQAISLKVETEHYRRSMIKLNNQTGEGLTMGALYWQLNEIWPGLSWSTLNFDGSWKMAHYKVKDSFTPTLVSPIIEGNLLKIYVVSDSKKSLPEKTEIGISTQRWDSFDSDKVDSLSMILNDPLEGNAIHTLDVDALLKRGNCGKGGQYRLGYCHFKFRVYNESTVFSTNEFFTSPNSLIGLKNNPNISVSVVKKVSNKEAKITLQSDAPALFVWLEVRGYEGRFDDNGFNLHSPTYDITFYSKKPIQNVKKFAASISIRFYKKNV